MHLSVQNTNIPEIIKFKQNCAKNHLVFPACFYNHLSDVCLSMGKHACEEEFIIRLFHKQIHMSTNRRQKFFNLMFWKYYDSVNPRVNRSVVEFRTIPVSRSSDRYDAINSSAFMQIYVYSRNGRYS